jgi:hypothetical protein
VYSPPTASALPDHPDRHRDRPVAAAPAPSRTASLLGLVRRLIDYGKGLANTLQQRTAATNLVFFAVAFRSEDIALILARITRGLLRAVALEARIVSRLAEEAKQPPAASTKPPRQPHATRAADRRAKPDTANARLALMPTPEAIAADVRRRPIGAVLADICRDLGMVAGHPLWRELNLAIMTNHGNAIALLKEMLRPRVDRTNDTCSIIPPMPPGWTPPPRQSFAPPMPPGWQPPTRPQPAAAFSTGPPDPVARTTSEA